MIIGKCYQGRSVRIHLCWSWRKRQLASDNAGLPRKHAEEPMPERGNAAQQHDEKAQGRPLNPRPHCDSGGEQSRVHILDGWCGVTGTIS